MYKSTIIVLVLLGLSACGSSAKNTQPGVSASPVGIWNVSANQNGPDGSTLGTITATTSFVSGSNCNTFLVSLNFLSGVCASATSPSVLSTTGAGMQPVMFFIGANDQTIANGATVYVTIVEHDAQAVESWFLGGTGIYNESDLEVVGKLSCQGSFGNPTNISDCQAWQNVSFSAVYLSSN